MPTTRNRLVYFFRFTCHQRDNCFTFYFCGPQKVKGKPAAFLLLKLLFTILQNLILKECVISIIKLSDLSSKTESLQANYYLGGSLSNAYI